MKFCTRCGSRLVDRESCPSCGRRRYAAPDSARTAEHPPAGDLPAFVFAYTERTLLSLVERKREVHVPFSYISGTVIDIQMHENTSHPLRIGAWSQEDDPATGPQSPIVGHKWQPTRNSVIRLKLGSGAERSFLLRQVRFRSPRRPPHHAHLSGGCGSRAQSHLRLRGDRLGQLRNERPEVEYRPCGDPSRVGPDLFF
jgi:hypothetical protein